MGLEQSKSNPQDDGDAGSRRERCCFDFRLLSIATGLFDDDKQLPKNGNARLPPQAATQPQPVLRMPWGDLKAEISAVRQLPQNRTVQRSKRMHDTPCYNSKSKMVPVANVAIEEKRAFESLHPRLETNGDNALRVKGVSETIPQTGASAADAFTSETSLGMFADDDVPYAIPADETLDPEAIPVYEMSKPVPNSLCKISRTEKIVKITQWSIDHPDKQDAKASNQLPREPTNSRAQEDTSFPISPTPRRDAPSDKIIPKRKNKKEQQLDRRANAITTRVETITKTYDPELQRIIQACALECPPPSNIAITEPARTDNFVDQLLQATTPS